MIKFSDLHIDVSSSVIMNGKNLVTGEIVSNEFANQLDNNKLQGSKLDLFVGVIFYSEFGDTEFTTAEDAYNTILQHIEVYKNLINANHLQLVKSRKDLDSNKKKIILNIEGLYGFKNTKDITLLEKLIKNQFIRMIGPLWNKPNIFFDDTMSQLTEAGTNMLNILSKNSIILDLAHTESNALNNLVEQYEGPILDSHTNLFSFKEHRRNITDEKIKLILDKDGLIGFSLVGTFIGSTKLESIVSQIKYFIKHFGANNLAIGSDFDGMRNIDVIEGLENVMQYDNLALALNRAGVSKSAIEKILTTNSLDFFRRSLPHI